MPSIRSIPVPLTEICDLSDRLIGSYYAEWVGEIPSDAPAGTDVRIATIRKLNATRGTKIIISVYRIDAGHIPRYTVRVPGHRGFFPLSSFLFWGNAEVSAAASAHKIREEEEHRKDKAQRLKLRNYNLKQRALQRSELREVDRIKP